MVSDVGSRIFAMPDTDRAGPAANSEVWKKTCRWLAQHLMASQLLARPRRVEGRRLKHLRQASRRAGRMSG